MVLVFVVEQGRNVVLINRLLQNTPNENIILLCMGPFQIPRGCCAGDHGRD